MIKLNLTDSSGTLFKINKFPDGQQDIELNDNFQTGESVCIQSRFNSFRDLELILCTTAALKRLGTPNIELYIPYLLGGRSDRKFKKGGTSYLKDIISPIINAQGYSRVSVFDPHNSAVTDCCINNLEIIDNTQLVRESLNDIGSGYTIACPDEGASKKIYPLLREIGYRDHLIVCSKVRDSEGRITNTSVGDLTDCHGRKVVIIDDICDGGRTFIEIARKILPLNCDGMYLIVSHGIFSAGFTELEKYFRKIYCTNSFSDISHLLVQQTKII